MSYIYRIKTLKLRQNLKHLMSYAFSNVPFSELIKTADGGQISLDWFDNGNSTCYVDASTRPTILLLPGLTGTSKESYILHMIHLSEELGYRYQ
jgi:predicted alpha/beta-fold hydrolase